MRQSSNKAETFPYFPMLRYLSRVSMGLLWLVHRCIKQGLVLYIYGAVEYSKVHWCAVSCCPTIGPPMISLGNPTLFRDSRGNPVTGNPSGFPKGFPRVSLGFPHDYP